MSTADWVVIVVVAVAGIYGISTGFLRGAFSLAGFAFGAYLGARLAPLILTDGSPYVPVVALASAVLCGMLMRGLAALLAGALRTSIGVIPGMRFLDRLAGLALGLVAGVFLCWAIGAVLLYLPGETDLRRTVQRSTILSEINDVVPPERLLEELERVDPIGVFLGPPAIVAPPDKGIAKDSGRGSCLEERRPGHRDRLRARRRGLWLGRSPGPRSHERARRGRHRESARRHA